MCVGFALGWVAGLSRVTPTGSSPLSQEPRTLGTPSGCLADAGDPPRAGNHESKCTSMCVPKHMWCWHLHVPVPPMQSQGEVSWERSCVGWIFLRAPVGSTCTRLLGQGPHGNEPEEPQTLWEPSGSPLGARDGKLELRCKGWVRILQHLLQ